MQVPGAAQLAIVQPLTQLFSVAAEHVLRLPPQLAQPLTHCLLPLQ